MIVKSDRILWKQLGISAFFVVLFTIVFSINKMPVKLVCFFCGLCFYIIVCKVVSLGKTITMNEKGCILYLFGYKKIYQWEQLKIKYIEDRRQTFANPPLPYRARAIFSIRKLHKPSILFPHVYNTFIRPFSFSLFYVYYRVPTMQINRKIYPNIYPVDEKEFLEKMQEWGIELEVHTSRGEQYK